MDKKRSLTKEDAKAAALGGAVLGGGGGGSRYDGEKVGLQALEAGAVELVSIDSLPIDAVLLTVSAVGAPAAKHACALPQYYIQAVERFIACFGCRPAGIITNECGGNATMNGWLQAAVLQLPLVDAPCNGRAHPTGVMGAVSLQKEMDFVSQQVAIGGDVKRGSYVELIVSGSLEKTSVLVRRAAVEAEGLVAVARNPVTVGYAREHAAVGAIEQCIALGKVMLAAQENGEDIVQRAADFLQGEILMEGCIEQLELITRDGFDVGSFKVVNQSKAMELTFWNEYMTLEDGGNRLGTFPDLIMTFAAESGLPVSTAEIHEGMIVQIMHVKSTNLHLGSGMYDQELFDVAEKAVSKSIISYVFQ